MESKEENPPKIKSSSMTITKARGIIEKSMGTTGKTTTTDSYADRYLE